MRSWVLSLTLLFLSCTDSIPSDGNVAEDPPPPSIDTRQWSTPQNITALVEPLVETPAVKSVSIDEFDRISVTLSVGLDTLSPSQHYAALVLTYNEESSWSDEAKIEGNGIFSPSTSIRVNGETHLFWASVSDDAVVIPPGPYSNQVLHCILVDNVCDEQRIVYESPSTRFLILTDVALDENAQSIRVAVGDVPAIYEYEYNLVTGQSSAGLLTEGVYPQMYSNRDGVQLIYIRTPDPPLRGIFNVWVRSIDNGQWSEPTQIHHNAETEAHVPTYAVDKYGRHHAVWVDKDLDSDSLWVLRAMSRNKGKSWLPAKYVVHRGRSLWADPPRMIKDSEGNIHLALYHWGYLPYVDTFYLTMRDSTWSEKTVLFPEYDKSSPVFMVADSKNQVHALWRKDDELFHSVLR